MVQENILATILINNYNNQKYIKKCIKSCLNQSYKNLEIIIYDDLSSDGSKEIIKKIKNKKIKKIFNNKKKYRSSPLNQLEAINRSFLKSKGDIIFVLDGDDFFLKNKVEFVVNVFKKNHNLNFVQDNPIYYYPKKNLKVKKKIKKKLITFHTWPYFNPTSTMVFKRNLLKKILKDIYFSKNIFGRMFFDARVFIYIHFFEKNYIKLDKYLTMYTQNIQGDTIKNYNKKNLHWWKRRFDYHKFVKLLFFKKNKFHIKLVDYYITFLINFFIKKGIIK